MNLDEFTTGEISVLGNVQYEFHRALSKDTVNKIYRQARNWVRYHWSFECACSREHAIKINSIIKKMRWERLKELGYKTKLSED